MSVASSRILNAFKDSTLKYSNQSIKQDQSLNAQTKIISGFQNSSNIQSLGQIQNENPSSVNQSLLSQSNNNSQVYNLSNQNSFQLNPKGNSSRQTSGPNTCIKVSNSNKNAQYRYSGSPDQNEFEEDEMQDNYENSESNKLNRNGNSSNNKHSQSMQIQDLDKSNQDGNEFNHYLVCGKQYRNDEMLPNVIEEISDGSSSHKQSKQEYNKQYNSKYPIIGQKGKTKENIPDNKVKQMNNNRFQYVISNMMELQQQQQSRQLFAGQNDQEEAFLFDSLNSQANQQQVKEENNQQSILTSQMQITLKQAVASFAQEKQMHQQLQDLKKENNILKEENFHLKQNIVDKDDELKELRIQLKDMEIRLCHAEGMIKRERQEKENNAISFKRILQNITAAQNKENNPLLNSLSVSQKKQNSRKLSQQLENHQNIELNQKNYKFLMNDLTQGGTLGAITTKTLEHKTIEHQNTIGDYSTLDQIQKLKSQLTFKEEELLNLKKQHRRAGNQSVWWFNNRGQPQKNQFNQSSSAGYSPLPTQPSMPSYYQNPLLDHQKSSQKIKPYQQQYQMLSPLQGSPILSNQGSINSWINQNISHQQQVKIGQFRLGREDFRASQTEGVINDNSFDQETSDEINNNSTKDIFRNNIQQDDLNNPSFIKGKQSPLIGGGNKINADQSDLLGEDEDLDPEPLGNECLKEEKKLEMMISGGDYSPNSHTFFKHPFKPPSTKSLTTTAQQQVQMAYPQQQNVQTTTAMEKMNNSKIVVLNKCPKHEKQISQSAQTHQRKQDIHQEQKKSLSFYGSILSNKQKGMKIESPLTVFNKGPQSKQVSRKQSPLNIKLNEQNHHQTLDNSDLMQSSVKQKQLENKENDNRVSLGLGPHNTMGTTIVTSTFGMNTSNISPFKQGKKLIPDSLVKMPKFSANTNQNHKKLNVSNYRTINR